MLSSTIIRMLGGVVVSFLWWDVWAFLCFVCCAYQVVETRAKVDQIPGIKYHAL